MNANTIANLQNETVAVIKRFNEVIGDITDLKLKYDAVDGSNIIGDGDVLNTGVTGLEFKTAITSLDTMKNAYTGNGHKTNLYKVTG